MNDGTISIDSEADLGTRIGLEIPSVVKVLRNVV